jgi:hypothetical protein
MEIEAGGGLVHPQNVLLSAGLNDPSGGAQFWGVVACWTTSRKRLSPYLAHTVHCGSEIRLLTAQILVRDTGIDQ